MTDSEIYDLCRGRTMFESYRWTTLRETLCDLTAYGVAGCLVEIGVHAGGILGYMGLRYPDRKCFGYCRFDDGFPDVGPMDGSFSRGMMAYPLSNVQDWLSHIGATNVTLIKGDVHDTLNEPTTEQIALAIIDLNLYLPTKHALAWCRKHMASRGVILVDDKDFSGVKLALEESGLGWPNEGYMAKIKF